MFRNISKKYRSGFLSLTVLIATTFQARASTTPANLSIGNITGNIYNLIYPVAIIYGVFEILIAGLRIMKSEGEPRALADAKAHLTDSIIGVFFVMLAAVILKVIIKSFLAQDVNL